MSRHDAIEIADHAPAGVRALLDAQFLALLATLLAEFADRYSDLLAARHRRQQRFDNGELPELSVADRDCSADPAIPPCLDDRRVELQSPLNAEALLVALNSAASTVVVNLEQMLPSRASALAAQALLREVVKDREPDHRRPVLIFAPRCMGRGDGTVRIGGEAAPAALLDVALYLYANNASLTALGHGPFLHLPGIDAPEEAEFWADIFDWLHANSVADKHAIKVTAGIDSVNAVFVADGIVEKLGGFVTAVATDYHACLRSFIHTFRRFPQYVLPDRDVLTPACHFLRAWGLRIIRSAHQHGIHSIAACATPPPGGSEQVSRSAQSLRNEIEQQVRDGFDGCSVSQPELVDIVGETYDRLMPGRQQLQRWRGDLEICGADVLQVVKGRITAVGMRQNIRLALLGSVALADGKASLDGHGNVESATSVALAADQLWQWVRQDTGVLDDGRIIDEELFRDLVKATAAELNTPPDRLRAAIEDLQRHVLRPDISPDFLSIEP